MSDAPASLWISPIKQGRETGYMVADYAARGAREYVLRTIVGDAAAELLTALKDIRYQTRYGTLCEGFAEKQADDLIKRLENSKGE